MFGRPVKQRKQPWIFGSPILWSAMPPKSTRTLRGVIDHIAKRSFAVFDLRLKDGRPAFDPTVRHGDGRLVILFGGNATGKSLICSIIESELREAGIEIRNACMRNRTSGGIERALLLGNEGTRSTGAATYSFMKRSLTATFSQGSKAPALSIIDEPDIGMAEEYSIAMGHFVAGFANQLLEDYQHLAGIVLVSHNRSLIRTLLEQYRGRPTTIGMSESRPIEEWITAGAVALPAESLDALLEEESERRRLVYGLAKLRP